MIQKLRTIKSTTLTVILAVYFYCVLNLTLNIKLYAIMQETEGLGPLFWLTVPVFFIAAFTILFNFFTIKYLTKPFFILMIFASAAVNYGTYKFGIIFNPDMMTNIFETTSSEAASYANPAVFVWLFLTAILPIAWLLWIKIEYRPFRYELLAKIIVFTVSVAVIGLIAAFFYKDYAATSRNHQKIVKDINPTYYLGSTYKYVNARFLTEPLPYKEIGEDANRRKEKEKYLVVFMVGETARSQNYQANGYDRPTNAYTQQLKNVLSFRDVESCGTATAVSLPCMFSFLDRDNYSREKFEAQDNVVDVVKRGGVKVIWVDNNTGCKGVCNNVESYGADEALSLDCKGEDCTDNVFIDTLDQKVKELNGQDGLIMFHLIGSHGPTYYKRYPTDHAKFTPDCETSDLQKCTDEQILNSYDNSILYTDYIMAQLIKKLQSYSDEYETSLVYVSDHGESLGENGIYLHGMPYSIAPLYQKRVPFMVWMSDGMIEHKKIDMDCLKAKQTAGGISHDNLSPTLLHLMDIDTTAYRPELDILKACQHGDID